MAPPRMNFNHATEKLTSLESLRVGAEPEKRVASGIWTMTEPGVEVAIGRHDRARNWAVSLDQDRFYPRSILCHRDTESRLSSKVTRRHRVSSFVASISYTRA